MVDSALTLFRRDAVDPFVEDSKECCEQFPTRSKWVFVPTHALSRTFGERLVLEGTNWLNLRFVTPLDLALRMGAPSIVERGIDPSEESLAPALMMRPLMDPLSPGCRLAGVRSSRGRQLLAMWAGVSPLEQSKGRIPIEELH